MKLYANISKIRYYKPVFSEDGTAIIGLASDNLDRILVALVNGIPWCVPAQFSYKLYKENCLNRGEEIDFTMRKYDKTPVVANFMEKTGEKVYLATANPEEEIRVYLEDCFHSNHSPLEFSKAGGLSLKQIIDETRNMIEGERKRRNNQK